jgi:predicted membrane protein
MKPDRVLIGLILVALGVLFLLDRAGNLEAGQVISDWWPVVFLGLGLATLAERPVSLLGPLVLLAAGVVGLLFTLDLLEASAWNVVWPSALIIAGVVILLRHSIRRGRRAPAGGAGDDVVRASAFLGGSEVVSQSKAFRGAMLMAILGGAELDLRTAQLAEEGADIDATAILGGIDVIVPRSWRVSVRGTPILGGVGNATEGRNLPEDGPSLRVDALAILGGVDVKHEK